MQESTTNPGPGESPIGHPVVFSLADMELFQIASGDTNPIHVSESYARRTPFGEPIVFGVLQLLACLAQVPNANRWQLSSVRARFYGPVYPGIKYTHDSEQTSGGAFLSVLRDGRRTLSEFEFWYTAGTLSSPVLSSMAAPTRSVPADLQRNDLIVGKTASGRFAPSWQGVKDLCRTLGLAADRIDLGQIAILFASSYLVGMEMPGKRAVFRAFDVEFGREPVPVPFGYEMEVTRVSNHGDLSIVARLTSASRVVATVNIVAAVLRDLPAPNRNEMTVHLPESDALLGRVALVTGASRGLGAAVATALCTQGCTVFANYHKSHSVAEQLLQSVAATPGDLRLLPGDAADLDWCRHAGEQIDHEHGKLDFLVCNATPIVKPLPFEPCSATRITPFVTTSLEMGCHPMLALLGLVERSAGWAVVISSSYVTTCPIQMSHYVAAKAALEAITRVAAREFRDVRFLIVRPPRLLTDQTNAPSDRVRPMSTSVAAAKIIRRLLQPPADHGDVAMLEDFR